MQTTKQQLFPALRFPEFEGEWQRVKLGEIGEFRGGGTPSTKKESYWMGNIPWVSSSDLEEGNIYKINISKYITEEAIDNSATKLLPANSILIVSRVGVGKLAINEVAICTSQDFSNFISKNCHVHYVALYLEHHKAKLKNLSQGTSIKGFTLDVIKTFKINIPSQPAEQQKIAHFLATIDKKKALLEELSQHLIVLKKGLMQQLFSQQLRFWDKNGEEFPAWEVKRLGEVFERVKTKNKENNKNVLTISAQLGLISQLEFFSKTVSAKNIIGYYLLEKGDFAYNKSYSKGYPLGAIKKLNRYDKGVVSTLYICFKPKNKQFSPFFEKYFEHSSINKELYKIAQEGARNHGLLNVSIRDFFELIKIPLPSLPEQEKIVNLLSCLDQKIQNIQAQLEEMQDYKKGLLQQILV